MNVAVLTTLLPFARRSGGEVCSARLVEALGGRATERLVIGFGDPAVPPGASPGPEVLSLGPSPTEFAALSTAGKIAAWGRAFTSRQAWSVQRWRDGRAGARLCAALAGRRIDLVVIDHLQMAAWLDLLPAATPSMLMAHNVEPEVYAALAAHSTNAAARWALAREQRLLARLDAEALRRVGAVACLTATDAAHYRRLAATLGVRPRIEVLPGFFADTAGACRECAPAAPVEPGPAARLRRRIGLIGTWNWQPNRIGLDWFVREVLPRLDCADCEVVIAGRGLTPTELPSGVCAVGFVPSAAAFYEAVDLIAIPSLTGSGVQEKTIEAIGAFKPVVATTPALRGLGECPPHVHCADTPAGFADACRRALADPAAATAARRWNAQRRADYGAALARLLGVASADVSNGLRR